MDLRPGTVIDGRYVVEAELGRGGMAAVYRVRHAQLGTLAALKVLSTSAHSVQKRLMKEGRAQAALQHPNIVSVSDVVVVNDAPGLVMEYVRGPSLDQLLDNGPLTVSQADAIVRGVLAGVLAAHEHGLVHRDLKPANIMLSIHGGGLVPKVADFGLVKLVTGDSHASLTQTHSGVAMGTPAYMAPEQINDARGVDQRADIFSLGAILYELLTGLRAFRGPDLISVFTAIKDADYTPIRCAPEVPQRMIDAIDGALQPDREDRIQDTATLLQIWTGGDTAQASPWDPILLTRARSMGGGGTSSKDALRQPLPEPISRTAVAVAPTPAPPSYTMLPEAIGTAPGSVGMDSWALPPAEVAPERPPVPRPSAWLGLGLASFLAAVATGVGVGLYRQPEPIDTTVPAAQISSLSPGPSDTPTITRTAPLPSTAPARIEAPTPTPEAAQATPEPSAPSEASEISPELASPAPSEAPQQTVPQPPRVWVNSDVTVAFVNEHGRPTPAEALVPGAYEIQAFFDVATPTSQGTHRFIAGENWAVRCKSASMRCSVTRRD